MSSAIQNIYSGSILESRAIYPAAKLPSTQAYLRPCIAQVILNKEKNIQEITSFRSRIRNLDEWVLIGGGLFTVGYLALTGILTVSQSLAQSPQIRQLLGVFGLIGGLFNIFEGIVTFKNSVIEWNAGHKQSAIRLFFEGLFLTTIGVMMFLTSLGGTSLLLAHNPWILPLLFFLANFPTICEVATRLYRIHNGTTTASQIFASQFPIFPSFTDKQYSEKEILKTLSDILEDWQDSMGAQLAVALFKYKAVEQFHPGISTDKIRKEFEKRKKEWEEAQWIRAFYLTLCIAAFFTSFVRVSSPSQTGRLIFDDIRDISMLSSNLLPIAIDTLLPLKRGTYLPVPGMIT
ncbi:MAG TPA: hypothetical protein VJK48_04825 [Chlamydiales bacterium]|nr:MAG: hypothetical protein A3F67_09355 [Verrucomicrobia bacterium RIFCSPHIGHO2_12_FULL_41_10]HLB53013.1 hypothetical protein [Chlamydiales bacterium]